MVSSALTKDDHSPVTVADFAAQALVGYGSIKLSPGCHDRRGEFSVLRPRGEWETLARITSFVSQFAPAATPENVCQWIDRGSAQSADRYWTLDPIDGTKGFLRGDQYAVALALVHHGEVQVGALGCPISRWLQRNRGWLLMIAARGQGTWMTAH